MKKPSMLSLLREVDTDESGTVSLETILIIGAIALPVLIFLLRIGWPRIKGYFVDNMDKLDAEVQNAP